MSVLNLTFPFLADGSTKICNVPLSTDYMFFGVGDFGGGLLTLEASPDLGVTWLTVDEMMENGRFIRYLSSGEQVRLTLTGAISPDISAGIRQ